VTRSGSLIVHTLSAAPLLVPRPLLSLRFPLEDTPTGSTFIAAVLSSMAQKQPLKFTPELLALVPSACSTFLLTTITPTDGGTFLMWLLQQRPSAIVSASRPSTSSSTAARPIQPRLELTLLPELAEQSLQSATHVSLVLGRLAVPSEILISLPGIASESLAALSEHHY
jgi:hypothetical protein